MAARFVRAFTIPKGITGLAAGCAVVGIGALCYTGMRQPTSFDQGKPQPTSFDPITGVPRYAAPVTRGTKDAAVDESDKVRKRLRHTFGALTAGVGITVLTAASIYRTRSFHTTIMPLLLRRPIATTVGSIALMCGTMFGTIMTPKENWIAKGAMFTAFNASTGFVMAPLCVLGGPLLAQASLITAGMVGALGLVAANSPSDRFMTWAGPLSMGLGAVCVASFGTLLFPAAAIAPLLANVSLYGGLVVFGGLVLVDVSKMMRHAATFPDYAYDPINESIFLYLDTVNIFVSMAEILAKAQTKKK